MTKAKTLQDKLAQSLDHANTREAKVHRQAPAPLPADRRCTKLSISLFQTDLERLQAIRSYMAQRGAMISTSQAVKLALRTAALSDDLQQALDAIRVEDGRKW
jgi:glutamate-1-semialdehyde aminotransferase